MTGSNKMSDARKAYKTMIEGICDLYGVTAEAEHELVHEFHEGEIPLFKLILAPINAEEDESIIVSFHLDLDTVQAIQWYLRLQDICPPLKITHCYYRDDRGETFVGEEAEIVRMYKLEQATISEWIRQNEQTDEEVTNQEVIGRLDRPKKQVYVDRDAAVAEFNKMRKGDKDEYH